MWHDLHRSVRFDASSVPPSHRATSWSTSPPMPSVRQTIPSRHAQTLPQSAHSPFDLAMASCLAARYFDEL